jgi:hypothetical protein
MQELEQTLNTIKKLEDEKSLLEEKIKSEREKVFNKLEEEQLGQYKSDIATVSYVEKKTLKFEEDKENILQKIEEQGLRKYYDIIPEHKELNKTFDKDIKDGKVNLDGVNVEVKKMPMIRFNK